jgi:hypothetical protein
LLLRLWLPGVAIPSLNQTKGLHWALVGRIRQAWSIMLARCLCGLHGSVDGALTATISRAAASSYGMQSRLPLDAAAILMPTACVGSTHSGRRGSAKWRGR